MALEIHTEGLDGWCDPVTGVCHIGASHPAEASSGKAADIAEQGGAPAVPVPAGEAS